MGEEGKSARVKSVKAGRIEGLDLARALAVIGMVVINFRLVMTTETASSIWLAHLTDMLEGRAAAVFVILAGVGLSLLTRKARMEGNTVALRRHRRTIRKRALFLFTIGLLFQTVWPADILHFYGIYLLLGALMLRATDSMLLWGAGIVLSIGAGLQITLNYDIGWDWATLHYIDFWTPAGMARHLFFNGFHPVFPWLAFLYFGMWLGRQDLRDIRVQKCLAAVGAGMTLSAEGVAFLLQQWTASLIELPNLTDIQYLMQSGPVPPTLFYMLSAGGTALLVIVSCVALSERIPVTKWLSPLMAAGRQSLTLYMGHVLVGMGVLESLGKLEQQTIPFALAAALIFSSAGIIFAWLWQQRFKQGPVEWVMRRLT